MRHRKRSMWRPRNILLLTCFVLVMVIYWEAQSGWAPPAAGTSVSVRSPKIAAIPKEPPFRMPGLETYAETIARPLFSSTRRPPPEEKGKPKAKSAGPNAIDIVLMGIIITPESRIALIKEKKAREVIRLTVGEVVDTWRVEKILPDRVIFRSGKVTEEVRIEDRRIRRPPMPKPRRTKARRRGSGSRTSTRPAPSR